MRCSLRIAFDDDHEIAKNTPSSPSRRIGSAAHKLFDRARRGEVPTRELREEAWNVEIEAERCHSHAAASEAHWPRDPVRWPYYEARRAAALSLAAGLSQHATPTSERPLGGPAESSVEVKRVAFEGRLQGRIDVVVPGPPRRIEDYKTGAVTDPDTGDLRDEYRVQMLLYAVLEHAETGEWPVEARLIPLSGPPVSIDIDPGEATGLAEDVLAALDTYQRGVGKHAVLWALGRPSIQNCRWCPFSVHCLPFWETADESWLEASIGAVAGHVVALSRSAGVAHIEIAGDRGTLRGNVSVRALPESQMPGVAIGSLVAVTGLRPGHSPGEVVATLSTRIVCMEEE